MSLSVIIPSRNFQNLRACVRALHENGNGRLIVVDDGLAETGYDSKSSEYERGFMLHGAEIVPGIKPFVYARNCNLGIAAAGSDDVILLNDDALLQTLGGFHALQTIANEHPEYGVISATTNVVGNLDQLPHTTGLRDAGIKGVAFVCVLIPRRTIDQVGLLDERFTAYGWEDNDYCRRVRRAGLKVGIFDGCFVDHGSLKSTFRGGAYVAGDIRAGAAIYREKWGDLA